MGLGMCLSWSSLCDAISLLAEANKCILGGFEVQAQGPDLTS